MPLNLKALIENLDDLTAERVVDFLRCYYTQHTRLAEALEDFNRLKHKQALLIPKP